MAENAQRQTERRRKLDDLAITVEELQTYDANAVAAKAQYQQAVANRDQAKVNLDRTEIRSPVNGGTNLLAGVGDYRHRWTEHDLGRRRQFLLGGRVFRRNAIGFHAG